MLWFSKGNSYNTCYYITDDNYECQASTSCSKWSTTQFHLQMLISFSNIWLLPEFFFCYIVSNPCSHFQSIKCCLIWFLNILDSASVDKEKPEGQQGLILPAFQHIPEADISVSKLDTGEALILICSGSSCIPPEEDFVPEVVIHHFTRGTE